MPIEINIPSSQPCPTFGPNNVGPISNTVNNDRTCLYDPSAFYQASTSQVDPYIGYFDLINDPDIDQSAVSDALSNFCFQRVSNNCPVDDIGGSVMPACAVYSTVTNSGSVCQSNIAFIFDPADQDQLYNNYCDSNETLDCSCVNPQPVILYNQLNQVIGLAGQPQCWWIPCKNRTGAYIIPPAYRDVSVCPPNVTICENINNFINATGNINVSEVDNYTGCGNASDGFAVFLENYWWISLIIIAIIVIIVLFYYFYYRRTTIIHTISQ